MALMLGFGFDISLWMSGRCKHTYAFNFKRNFCKQTAFLHEWFMMNAEFCLNLFCLLSLEGGVCWIVYVVLALFAAKVNNWRNKTRGMRNKNNQLHWQLTIANNSTQLTTAENQIFFFKLHLKIQNFPEDSFEFWGMHRRKYILTWIGLLK